VFISASTRRSHSVAPTKREAASADAKRAANPTHPSEIAYTIALRSADFAHDAIVDDGSTR